MNEPKRKVKYSIDPNALTWAKDESKFGKRLMEKMGWEQGKGLGAKEDGIKEHIKIKFKDDNKGVGFNKNNYDNVWIDHQDSFDSLLNNLKKETSDETLNVDENAIHNDDSKIKSLEEKSKSSRARVHYRKFTKSKDLTNATKVDLDCILGRHKRKSQPKEEPISNDESSKSSSSTGSEEAKPVPESSFKTITNTLSINDYFAAKMAEIKKRKFDTNKENGTEVTVEVAAMNVEEVRVGNGFHSDDTEESTNKRKKKKSKKKENEDEILNEANGIKSSFKTTTNTLSINDYFAAKMAEIKKRKLDTNKENGTEVTVEVAAMNVEEVRVENGFHSDDTEESTNKRKKKKSKKKENEDEILNEANDFHDAVNQADEVKVDAESENVDCEVKKTKKKKKKDREHTEIAEESAEPKLDSVEINGEIENNNNNNHVAITETENPETDENVSDKKKRKKKKKDRERDESNNDTEENQNLDSTKNSNETENTLENNNVETYEEKQETDDSSKKKHKKKKKDKENEEEKTETNGLENSIELNTESITKIEIENNNETIYKTTKERLYKIQDPFKGSNLFDIVGYTPYVIYERLDQLLEDKIEKTQKKVKQVEKILKKNPDAYSMQKNR